MKTNQLTRKEAILMIYERKFQDILSYQQVRTSLIEQFRKLFLQITIIDVGAAFALPQIIDKVKSIELFAFGTILLFIPIPLSLFYLTYTIWKDIIISERRHKEIQLDYKKAIAALREGNKEKFQQELTAKIELPDYSHDHSFAYVLITIFTVGAIAVFLSFFI